MWGLGDPGDWRGAAAIPACWPHRGGVARRRPRRLAGVVGYSGMLADEAALADPVTTRPPILLIHGDADPMIPIAAFHRTRDALVRNGFLVESHVSPGLGHSIDLAGLQLGGRFLAKVLGESPG